MCLPQYKTFAKNETALGASANRKSSSPLIRIVESQQVRPSINVVQHSLGTEAQQRGGQQRKTGLEVHIAKSDL